MSSGRRWPTWLTETRLTLEAVSYVAAALGLFFAGFQILEANRARSIDATLSYLRVLNEDPLAGMQRQITDRWLEHRETLAAIQSGAISAPNIASFTREVIYGRAGEGPQPDLTTAVIALVRNLDQMTICVRTGLCDCEKARTHFSEYAREVHHAYAPIVADVRAAFGESSLGRELADFVEGEPCDL